MTGEGGTITCLTNSAKQLGKRLSLLYRRLKAELLPSPFTIAYRRYVKHDMDNAARLILLKYAAIKAVQETIAIIEDE